MIDRRQTIAGAMHPTQRPSRRSVLGRPFATIVTAVAAAVLSACASMAPTYERPAAPVPPAFDAAGGPASATAAAELEWQKFFRDPRLTRLIGIALENNRDLRVAALSIEQARAQYDVRRADHLPTVNAIGSGTRQPSAMTGRQSSSYTVGLGVSAFELDFFGRVRSLSDAALAQYLATEEAQRAAQISLVANVALTYLNLAADDEMLEVTRQTLATREESLQLTKLRFDNGAASELDYQQAESLVQGARVSLASQSRQRAQDQNALVALLGQPMPTDLPAGMRVMDQQLVSDLPAGLPSEVLVNRPDVLQAEQQLMAANANIGAARAAFFPRISLTGTAGFASGHLEDLFTSGRFAWTFAPQIVLPIFDHGRNQANLEISKISREIAVAQYEKAIQTAFREVSDALVGRATLGNQVRAQRLQVNAEEARLRLADLRYKNGAASYLDVLDAQRSLFTAQQAVVQAQTAQQQNLVTLYRVLGGGWK